ncbi:unnamed protein product [Sphagnum balticum]
MQDHNEFFAYGQNGPWWMQTMPPPGWQLVPVGTTAKPKEPEKVFTFGPGGPTWMPPPGTRWQLVEDKKADNKDKKPAEKKEEKKEKNPELVMNVKMCCEKCEDIVKERVWEVPGVVDVKTDRVHSKVLVVGKVEKSEVLKKAKKVDKKANLVVISETKKAEEKKKQEEKKDAAGSSNKTIANVIYNPPPYPYYPYYPPTFMPPVPNFAPYTPTQPYSPYYNPQSDYPYYNYPHNSHYY